MKKILVSTVAIIAFTAPARSAILVTDLENLVSNIQNQFNTAKSVITENLQWVKQLQQYEVELQSYYTQAQQLLAFVHNPSLGAAGMILGQVGLGNSLPSDLYSAQSLVSGVGMMRNGSFSMSGIGGILGSLSSMAGTTYDKNHVYTDTSGTTLADILNNKGAALSSTQAAGLTAYEDLRTHSTTLPALRKQGQDASNPLDMAAVQTQVQIETAWNVNQLAQTQALSLAASMEDKIRTQREDEQISKSLNGQLEQAKAAGVPGL